MVSLCLFIYRYSKKLSYLNYNVRGYSLLDILMLTFILISLCIVGPVLLSKIFDSATILGLRYQGLVKESIRCSMSDTGEDANTFVIEDSSNHSNTATAKSGWVQARSESNSNSILNTAETITSSTSEGTGIGTSIANASANLSQQNNGSNPRSSRGISNNIDTNNTRVLSLALAGSHFKIVLKIHFKRVMSIFQLMKILVIRN